MVPFVVLGVVSAIAWGAWVFVLYRFDPRVSGLVAHGLFYGSLALAFLGTLILAGLLWHWRRRAMAASRGEVGVIVRQAFLAVTFVIVALLLAANHLLKWWNVIPLMLFAVTLELFFMSLDKRGKRTHRRARSFDSPAVSGLAQDDI